MRKQDVLVTPPTGEFAWKENTPKDFVSREEFINRTGIFVTPSQFGFIYDVDFRDSNMTVDEFISKFEEDFSGEIMEVEMKGTFKYMVMDEAVSCLGEFENELHDPNIWDIVNSLARMYEQECEVKWNLINKLEKIIKEVMQTNNECVQIIKDMQLQSANPTSEMAS